MIASTELIAGYETGISRKDLAEQFGVSAVTITNRLKKLKTIKGSLQSYMQEQSTEISLLKVALMENITKEKLQEASLDSLVRATSVLDKIERLDAGKATSNNALLIQHIEAVGKLKSGTDARLIDNSLQKVAEEVIVEDEEEFSEEGLFSD